MSFSSATRVRHAVLLLVLIILVSVADRASATAASLCGKPPPNVDGVYTTDIELTEIMESSLKESDGDVVIAGVLEGGSLDEKPFLVGPGEYSSLYSFALNASAADPLLVEMSVVFPCTPDPDFQTGCVDGFTYADDQRPRSCVWAVNGPCSWRLHCADEVRSGSKHSARPVYGPINGKLPYSDGLTIGAARSNPHDTHPFTTTAGAAAAGFRPPGRRRL